MERRAALIAAARALFASDGFEGVSIRKVTERAGCATMNFYTYFTNKRDLLHAIWADVFSVVLPACEAEMAAHQEHAAKAVAFGVKFTRFWVENPDSYRIVFLNQDMPSKGSRYFVDEADLMSAFNDYAALFVGSQTMSPIAALNALLALCIGLAHALVTIPEYPAGDDQLIDHAVAAMVSGLLNLPADALSPSPAAR